MNQRCGLMRIIDGFTVLCPAASINSFPRHVSARSLHSRAMARRT
ncbi:MAG TPA: hypothetical protein VKD22_12475 [Ramlibacter sp.]|nr:hypothetical protein [Ramlibacter sp.]